MTTHPRAVHTKCDIYVFILSEWIRTITRRLRACQFSSMNPFPNSQNIHKGVNRRKTDKTMANKIAKTKNTKNDRQNIIQIIKD